MKPPFLALFLCLLLAVSGCGDSTNPSSRALGIYGKVVDAHGAPVVGAEIVQLYAPLRGGVRMGEKGIGIQGDTVEIVPPQGNGLSCSPLPVESETSIRFSVEEAMPVSLSIISMLTGQTAVTPMEERVLHAGNYTVSWQLVPAPNVASALRNGVYRIRLVKNQAVVEKDVLVDSRKAAAVAVTDGEGKFFIGYKYFPMGFRSDVVDVAGRVLGVMEVSPSAKLLVRQQGVAVKEQDIVVDTEQTMDVTIVLPQ